MPYATRIVTGLVILAFGASAWGLTWQIGRPAAAAILDRPTLEHVSGFEFITLGLALAVTVIVLRSAWVIGGRDQKVATLQRAARDLGDALEEGQP